MFELFNFIKKETPKLEDGGCVVPDINQQLEEAGVFKSLAIAHYNSGMDDMALHRLNEQGGTLGSIPEEDFELLKHGIDTFSFLLPPPVNKKHTLAELAKLIKETYSIENPKTLAVYEAMIKYGDVEITKKYEDGGDVEADEAFAVKQLTKIHDYAEAASAMLKDDTQLEAWLQGLVSKSEQMISDVKHALQADFPSRFVNGGEIDEPGKYVKSELLHIGNYARKLIAAIEDEAGGVKLEPWMKANISVVSNYIGVVRHYLEFALDKVTFETGGLPGGFAGRDQEHINAVEVSAYDDMQIEFATGGQITRYKKGEKFYDEMGNEYRYAYYSKDARGGGHYLNDMKNRGILVFGGEKKLSERFSKKDTTSVKSLLGYNDNNDTKVKVGDKVIFTKRPELNGVVKELLPNFVVKVEWTDDSGLLIKKGREKTFDVMISDITIIDKKYDGGDVDAPTDGANLRWRDDNFMKEEDLPFAEGGKVASVTKRQIEKIYSVAGIVIDKIIRAKLDGGDGWYVYYKGASSVGKASGVPSDFIPDDEDYVDFIRMNLVSARLRAGMPKLGIGELDQILLDAGIPKTKLSEGGTVADEMSMVVQGTVQWADDLPAFEAPVKIIFKVRPPQHYFKRGRSKVGISDSLIEYYKEKGKKIFVTQPEVVVDKIQYENILDTKEKVWWNPEPSTDIVLDGETKKLIRERLDELNAKLEVSQLEDGGKVMSYEEAIVLPKGGAVAMNEQNMRASAAEMIAHKHAMRPKAIYDWATKHDVDIVKYGYILSGAGTGNSLLKANSALLSDVLGDQYSATKKLIEKSTKKKEDGGEIPATDIEVGAWVGGKHYEPKPIDGELELPTDGNNLRWWDEATQQLPDEVEMKLADGGSPINERQEEIGKYLDGKYKVVKLARFDYPVIVSNENTEKPIDFNVIANEVFNRFFIKGDDAINGVRAWSISKRGTYGDGGKVGGAAKTARVLIISGKNPLSKQLQKLTGDSYGMQSFEDLEINAGVGSGISLIKHKATGQLFAVFSATYYDQVDAAVIKSDLSYLGQKFGITDFVGNVKKETGGNVGNSEKYKYIDNDGTVTVQKLTPTGETEWKFAFFSMDDAKNYVSVEEQLGMIDESKLKLKEYKSKFKDNPNADWIKGEYYDGKNTNYAGVALELYPNKEQAIHEIKHIIVSNILKQNAKDKLADGGSVSDRNLRQIGEYMERVTPGGLVRIYLDGKPISSPRNIANDFKDGVVGNYEDDWNRVIGDGSIAQPRISFEEFVEKHKTHKESGGKVDINETLAGGSECVGWMEKYQGMDTSSIDIEAFAGGGSVTGVSRNPKYNPFKKDKTGKYLEMAKVSGNVGDFVRYANVRFKAHKDVMLDAIRKMVPFATIDEIKLVGSVENGKTKDGDDIDILVLYSNLNDNKSESDLLNALQGKVGIPYVEGAVDIKAKKSESEMADFAVGGSVSVANKKHLDDLYKQAGSVDAAMQLYAGELEIFGIYFGHKVDQNKKRKWSAAYDYLNKTKHGFVIFVTPKGGGFKPHVWIEGGKFDYENFAESQVKQLRKMKDLYKKVEVIPVTDERAIAAVTKMEEGGILENLQSGEAENPDCDWLEDKFARGGGIHADRTLSFDKADYEKLIGTGKFYADEIGGEHYIHELPKSKTKIKANALGAWANGKLKLCEKEITPLAAWLVEEKYFDGHE